MKPRAKLGSMRQALVLALIGASVGVSLGWSAPSQAQVFVYPRRPDKSRVRYFDFKWKHIELEVQVDEARELASASKPDPALKGKAETKALAQAAAKAAPSAPPVETGTLPEGEAQAPSAPPVQTGTLPGSETQAPSAPPVQTETLPAGGELLPQAAAAALKGVAVDGQAAEPARPAAADKTAASPTQPVAGKQRARIEGTGKVRLYFYERERASAERAAAFIEDSFRYLSKQFDFVPGEEIPYVLYNSYQEFLQTNLFPLQEGVLGVTSPEDLKMTLPYFGDHKLFSEVSTHEMAHQFTIQKGRAIARKADLWGDPLEGLPLWFIEGLAEFYAKRGIDPEAEMLVRDIVVNPDFNRGYAMLDFFEDRPGSVLWTYKVGQVRCAFLEDHYGKGTLQRIINKVPRLAGTFEDKRQLDAFSDLIQALTGDAPAKVSAAFSEWLKRRAFSNYLGSEVGAVELELLDTGIKLVDAMATAPGGHLMALRTMDQDTGQSSLMILDDRVPKQSRRLVRDGKPGAESLHPVSRRNFDLRDDAIVFVAQVNGRDHLYLQALKHQATKRVAPAGESTKTQPQGREALPFKQGDWTVHLGFGGRRSIALPRTLVAIESPAFSPTGSEVAFIGLNAKGQKDLYIQSTAKETKASQLRALTHDIFAERELVWGPSGLIFNSDATEDGHYNLFRISPQGGLITRLTRDARDHSNLRALRDGRVFFVAWRQARADLYQLQAEAPGGFQRLTQMDTGLFGPAAGPDGDLWGLWYHSGKREVARLPKTVLRLEPPELAAPLAASVPSVSVVAKAAKAAGAAPQTPRARPLLGALPYDSLRPSNWELGNLFGLFGAGGSGVFGQLVASASDKLRGHALLLNLFVFGSFKLTDGFLVYVNQQGRLTWGSGLFQRLLFRTDRTPGLVNAGVTATTAERFYGAMGSLRVPFNTYHYLQGDLSLGGTNYFLTKDTEQFLASGELNGTRRDLLSLWRDANEGARMQGELTLRYGYDTIRYHRATGPLSGSSLLLESTNTVQPLNGQLFGNLRLDAEHYVSLWGRANIFLRGGAGSAFGGRFSRQFYLSSFDTLRGVPFGDVDFLRGQHFAYTTLELQFPLNSIVRLILFSDIEAVIGADFGMVGDSLKTLLDKRVMDLVLGVNFGFGPLVFRLHFAKPVDTKANPLAAGVNRGLPNGGKWVTNFSLGWVYF